MDAIPFMTPNSSSFEPVIIRKCRKNYFRKVKIFISKNYTEDNFNLTDLTENLTIPSSSYIN